MNKYRYYSDLRAAGLLMYDLIFFSYKEEGDLEFVIGTDPCGYIPSREMFNKLVELWTKFYDEATDEWIEDRNEWRNIDYEGVQTQGRNGNHARPGYVYILHGGGYYKIGKTINISRRLDEISPKLPFKVELIHVIPTNDYTWAEDLLHHRFNYCRAHGEWFHISSIDLPWLLAIRRIDH